MGGIRTSYRGGVHGADATGAHYVRCVSHRPENWDIVLNLYNITETLQRLLALNVGRVLADMGRPTAVQVTTAPPERITDGHHQLNLHLFHAAEATYHRPMSDTGGNPASVVRQPLALSLSYVLTAHHTFDGEPDAREEQLLLGLGMKTLHDYRRIDGHLRIATEMGGLEPVVVADLNSDDTRLDISMRPTTPEEATMFWSSEAGSTTRLSAFYEVRTIVLDVDEPPTG